MQKALACRGEHTYLYAQMLLNTLYNNNKDDSFVEGTFIAKRIANSIELAAREKYIYVNYYLTSNKARFSTWDMKVVKLKI